MATKVTVSWQTGDGSIEATFMGVGDGVISIVSDPNESIDREQSIIVKTTDGKIQEKLKITQPGLREVFRCSDGDFILSDGGTFNTLKS